MTDVKESTILEWVAECVGANAHPRAAFRVACARWGQQVFKGRNQRERQENFTKLLESVRTTPVAFRLGLLNARRQDFLAEMIETAMKCDVPAEDCEDFVDSFKKAQNYPGAIPEALESLAEFNETAATDLLTRAKALWPQLNPKDVLDVPTTEAPVSQESDSSQSAV